MGGRDEFEQLIAPIVARTMAPVKMAMADAKLKAADIEAQSRVQAASIYGKAYAGSPQLYNMMRSLDTLSTIITPDTKLILRTDAAPFRALVEGPGFSAPSKSSSQVGAP